MAPRGLPAALGALLVVAAGLVAYHNSFHAAFVFDDVVHIEKNLALRRLWPLGPLLGNSTRPLVEFSLAVNYALGALDVRGYHAFNLLVHLLAGLALFGLVRRTMLAGRFGAGVRARAPAVALAAALLWVAHPLQTEAVTYVIQRSESMAALFYLLTLYALARGAASARPAGAYAAAVACCALGMASKPVMVTAPLAALLYDRVFLSPSIRETLARRWAVHLMLFATAGLLPLILASAPGEWRGTAGFSAAGVTPAAYLATQPGVILHYLRLALWPQPLVLDYGWPLARSAGEIVAPAVLVGGLLAASLVAFRGHAWLGFLGAWFFLALVPTSSFIPLVDPAFEHRMYLPLAAPAVLAAVALDSWRARGASGPRSSAWAAPLALAVAVAALCGVTVRRNQDYRSELAIWSDTALKRPLNARAHNNLGLALAKEGRTEEAIAQFREAIRIRPTYNQAYLDLGGLLCRLGRPAEALPSLLEAVRLQPLGAEARYNLGTALAQVGRTNEAAAQFAMAVRIDPGLAEAHNNLGVLLGKLGNHAQAMAEIREALRLRPDYADAHYNLANELLSAGQTAEAEAEFTSVLELRPGDPAAERALERLHAGVRHP